MRLNGRPGFVASAVLGLLAIFCVSDSRAQRGIAANAQPGASADTVTHEFAFTQFLGRYGQAVAVDRAGYVYVTGRDPGQGELASGSPSRRRYGGGSNDAFIAKYAPDGRALVYATYIGGGDVDMGEDIAVDAAGNAYITGITYSKNFPVTEGSVQPRFGGGDRDCFVAKLSADGSTLLYSTLLGGNGQDRCAALALDRAGNAYVTGSTNSKTFAASRRVPSQAPGQDWDVFAAKLDATGRTLEYVLRFGGSAGAGPGAGQTGGEFGAGIVVDAAGTAYVVGQTDSADFPIESDDQGRRDGLTRAFVVGIDAAGSNLLSGRYLGEASSRAAVALDGTGHVYVAGTFSAAGRLLIAKLTADLSRVVYSSAIAAGSSMTSDLAVDTAGKAHLVGTTSANTFPRLNPLQKPFAGTASQAFLIVLDAAGTAILSSTVGGGANDEGEGVAVDASGGIYLAGTTLGGDRSTFPGGRVIGDRTLGAFVAKVIPRVTAPPRVVTPPAMDFATIPHGEFEMGCYERHGPCARTRSTHPVRITRGFEIGKYEVTQAEWLAVMGRNPSRFKSPDLPVEQ